MRDIKQLHPDLQKKIAELQTLCNKKGLKIGISECYRTVAEQDALYAKGRTTAGAKVTNAKGSSYSSMHQWYIAFDFYREDGKGAYYNNDKFFEKVGALGKSIGLEWGGDWKSPKDLPHFQLKDWGSTATKLKALYKNPENFKATWIKAENKPATQPQTYPTLSKGAKGAYVGILQKRLNALGYDCGKVDESFGSKTEKALKKYQSAKGLLSDGICGAKTWASLNK